MPEPYQALLPHILAPVLWEKAGNVPPLVRFIAGCVRRDPQAVLRIDKLVRTGSGVTDWRAVSEGQGYILALLGERSRCLCDV